MLFPIIPPPHVAPMSSVPILMRHVLYALVPATLAYVWYFGVGIVINMLIASAAALAGEAVMLRFRGRDVKAGLADGTAIVTAVLLAFAIPPLAPWWLPALGSASAIVLAKHLYGGLGANLFNPAMVGYAILLISFPLEMTRWLPPDAAELGYQQLGPWQQLVYSLTGSLPPGLTIDALTQATPLDLIKDGLNSMRTIGELRVGPLFAGLGGHGWQWISSFTALGGLYLLYRGIIRWHIPVSLLGSLVIMASLFYFMDPSRFSSPGFHLFSGATMMGAFFIATDPVSAATTDRGRLIFGAGIGVLTYAIRTWGGYPDGLAFAVLLMNSTVPLLDRYTRPRIYGRT